MSDEEVHFWSDEIRCGKILGSGTYCNVLAVEDIFLNHEIITTGGDLDHDAKGRLGLAQLFAQARDRPKPSCQEAAQLAIYGKRTGPPKEIDDPEHEPAPKLALKRLRTEMSAEDRRVAKDDLRREFEILQILRKTHEREGSVSTIRQHPNIIEVFGVGWDRSQDSNTMTDDRTISFLLLSRIQTTLSKRLIKWRDDKGFGIYEMLSLGAEERRNQWVERVHLLSKVACALEHLHSHRILYRDVKPDNIGFDCMGIPRLFDMGLAKKVSDELRFRNGEELEAGIFHLTPETGTLRYMAVENGKGRPYGWSTDVYSFAILMHEVLSLRVPFGGISPRQFRDVVWTQGQRLVIETSWPDAIQEVLPSMWHSDPMIRPSIKEVVDLLETILRGRDHELFPRSLIPRRYF